MLREEAECFIDVPLEEVWEWAKDLENITSVIPRVEIKEKISEKEVIVRGVVLPVIDLPEQMTTGKARTIEVNESEKYTRTVTEGEIFEIETFFQCEESGENETKIYMEAKGNLKGFSGKLLEKILFLPITTKIVSSARVDEILKGVENNLKDYMRKHWKDQLEKKTKELEAFVYTVSHDLRTPLISIEGFSDILIEEFGEGLGEDGKHYLNRIQANVEKMDDFINDLLQLSRIGRKEPPKQEIDLKKVMEEVIDDLSTRIEEKEMQIELQEDFPSFYFERKRLYQIFSNFISNACKYAGDEKNPKLEIGIENKGDSWLLWAEDNGIGIEEENQEKIFEIFSRENRSDAEGTGVGLSIVKRIIESHNGEIWVESEKGKGSTFYVEFPKEEVQKDSEDTEKQEKEIKEQTS